MITIKVVENTRSAAVEKEFCCDKHHPKSQDRFLGEYQSETVVRGLKYDRYRNGD
jgi:hypothetical protein